MISLKNFSLLYFWIFATVPLSSRHAGAQIVVRWPSHVHLGGPTQPGSLKKLDMKGRWHQSDAVYDVLQDKDHLSWDAHNIMGDWSEHFEGDWKNGWLSGRVTKFIPGKTPVSAEYDFRIGSANQIVRFVGNQQVAAIDRGDLGPEAYFHAQDVVAQRQKQAAADAAARKVKEDRLADLAAHPQTDLDKQMERYVQIDSQSWKVNHYDADTVRHTKIRTIAGTSLLESDYFFNDGTRGQVIAEVTGGNLRCIEFQNEPYCRKLGIPWSTSLIMDGTAEFVADFFKKARDDN